jgi:hypothetical protein
MSTTAPSLHDVVVQRVQVWTGRRVRDLRVELADGEGRRVTLRGRADSYHVKQLAQHAAREALPDARVENAIVVG